MFPREGGHTQIPRAPKGPACLGLGVLRQGRPRPASQPDGPWDGRDLPALWRPGREPVYRAVQGWELALRAGGSCLKKIQVLGRGLGGVELLGGELGGKFWPPRGLSPKRRCPRSGRFSKPLRELPCCLRGAWDFGWLRPDLSLASEPARRVRWLVRVGRPRARLGGSAPATGTSATGQATDSVGSFASVGPGGAERGSGTCPPRDGDLRDGPGHGPPEPPPRTRSGSPWENKLQTYLAHLFRGARPRTT